MRTEYRVFECAIALNRSEGAFTVERPDGSDIPSWYGQALTSASLKRATIVGDHEGLPLWRLEDGWGVIKVPQLPLKDILARYSFVDLADFDLQGVEAEVIEQTMPYLNERVRRLHIGTHSHDIEGRLRVLLSSAHWTCLRDYACGRDNDTPFGRISFVDGVQTWTNPRL
jgi:hypothetical protein